MQGGSEAKLNANALLTSPTTKQVWTMPSIDVDFQIWGFTASGLRMRYLAVSEKSYHNHANWVRYLTEANGSYQVQVSSVVPSFGRFWARTDQLISPCSSKSDIFGCIPFAISVDIHDMELRLDTLSFAQ